VIDPIVPTVHTLERTEAIPGGDTSSHRPHIVPRLGGDESGSMRRTRATTLSRLLYRHGNDGDGGVDGSPDVSCVSRSASTRG
jgi:hypothetical protein